MFSVREAESGLARAKVIFQDALANEERARHAYVVVSNKVKQMEARLRGDILHFAFERLRGETINLEFARDNLEGAQKILEIMKAEALTSKVRKEPF